MRLRALAFSLFLICALCRAEDPASIATQLSTAETNQLQREARVVVDFLQNYHYSGRAFREIENKEMISRYIEELDPQYYFLTKEDTDFLRRRFDRTFKTVYLFKGDLRPAFEIFDLYATRVRERLAWIERRLAQDFDFTIEESHTEHRDPSAPKDALPADRRWELWLKEQVLQQIIAGRETPAAVAEVRKHYREFRRQLAAVDALAVRERFFDALIRSFDPHSGYFSADSAREFAVGMENAVAGVGLELRKENGQCLVAAVQPGGPADLLSDIQTGDIIDELSEGEGPVLDASRKPLRELVAMVRGQPGTTLRIKYHMRDTTAQLVVNLERTRVLLGDERAQGAVSVVPDRNGGTRRIGWIGLPAFYAAGAEAATTSATRDVRELLSQMTATREIDGLVIDLRNNPGGALTEAVALSGLFLPHGGVMLCRALDGSVTEMAVEKENKPMFTGPLVVLTSRHSASASEIFAGAMKAHHRAIIVGADSTFGKGTVQNYIELAQARQGVSPEEVANWGTLRLTAQRFYLPDGKTVQRAGIPSDIVLPAESAAAIPGGREADLPHALAAESITPPGRNFAPATTRTEVTETVLRHLREQAETHFKELPEWKLWREEQATRQAAEKKETFSLHLDTRRQDWREVHAKHLTRLQARRELTRQAAFATEPLELALLQPALAAHEAKLRAAKGEDGQPLLHRLHHGLFTVESDQGRLRRWRLDAIRFMDFANDVQVLAEAFSAGANTPVKAEEIALVLQDLDLLEHKNDEAVLACFTARLAHNAPAKAAITRGAEALLLHLATVDGEILRERPGLDVPLREGLRLAADWAAMPAPAAAP